MVNLLTKLRKFLTDDRAFAAWIKRCIFIIKEGIRMRYFCFDMKQIYDAALAWLKSEELNEICANTAKGADSTPN